MLKRIISFLSLFGSVSTLLCCALPVTLVSLGMGASFASFTASFPQVIWLTQRKDLLFLVTGVLLMISYLSLKRSRNLACPIDENQRQACESSKQLSFRFLWVTLFIYGVGLVFSYILPLFY